MARASKAKIVLVTCGTREQARKIARLVVGARLAACVNMISAPLESVYRWRGKVQTAKEFFLVMKTSAARLDKLEKEVHRLHRYEVPEFLALDVAGGSRAYLNWLHESVGESRRP
jgi:periplasmic divalent cation tolerance protein